MTCGNCVYMHTVFGLLSLPLHLLSSQLHEKRGRAFMLCLCPHMHGLEWAARWRCTNHAVTVLWMRCVSRCVQRLWTACPLSHSVAYALIMLFCDVCRSSTWIGELHGLGCPKNPKTSHSSRLSGFDWTGRQLKMESHCTALQLRRRMWNDGYLCIWLSVLRCLASCLAPVG